ncbi:MAG: hypothetical protein ACI9NC_001106 [Verrucomicrobiales bacterium]|jgi:hypothetical protein
MRPPPKKLCTALVTSALLSLHAGAETLNSLAEFGNAANSDATSGAGTARGGNFDNAGTDAYTLTAGGTDFWGASDHGSYIFDNAQSRAAGEDFSVVVRSVSIAGDPAEALAGEWGRTGPMVRKTPDVANAANVAHIRKSGSTNTTILQGRLSDGAGTDRGPDNNGEHANAGENNANGDVRNTPIWLSLHRVNDVWYSTWAVDDAGSPGPWSDLRIRAASADMAGEVWVGLAHQSHNINPVTNTAVFDNFSVGAFDANLGDFPITTSCDLTFAGNDIFLSAFGSELGVGPVQDINWEVRLVSTGETFITGQLKADIFLAANGGNIAAFDALVGPAGTTFVEHIDWNANDYTRTNDAGVNLFAEAVPGLFGGDESNYAIEMTGEIHIPNDVDRGNLDSVLFHDGVDDYCYLEIDGVVLIDNNQWSNVAGTGNNGGTQATLDVSDGKYNDGEWVNFRMVTWETGGGDDAILVWDALDRTGADSITGSADATTESYLGTGLGDGAQVAFAHDTSDIVPAENFRVAAPAFTVIADGVGQPSNLMVGTIAADTVAVELFVEGVSCVSVPVLPTLDNADFTSLDVVTIVLADVGTGGTADIDEATLVLQLDGSVIAPTSVSHIDQSTTITYILPTPAAPYTFHNFTITGTTTGATGAKDFSISASPRSWPFLEELRAGLTDPPNAATGWDYMEFLVVPTLGRNLGATEQGFIDAQTVINTASVPDARIDQPYVNHRDPDSGGTGDWCPDLPILIDTVGVDDNQYITYARTMVTIGEADPLIYTFRIRGDDGYGLRATGASFTSVAGGAPNTLDSRDPSVVFYPNFTGDSNSFAVCEFPASGDYLIEFFGFEGGGGAYQEVSWAPGAFSALGQTIGWRLLGDTSNFVSESKWAAINESVLPPDPIAPDSGWSTYIWYDAAVGTLGNTINFINGADPGAATATVLQQLNHSDDGGGGGRFGANDPFPGDPNVGAATDNIAMLARAYVVAPVDGDYTIQVRSDDGFLLRFVDPANVFTASNGLGTVHPNAQNEAYVAAGTGDSNTRAVVNLTAGTHELLYIWWEGQGGANFEVSAAPGVELSQDGPYELLSTTPSASNLYLGKPQLPSFDIIDFIHDTDNDTFTLSWTSQEDRTYILYWNTDLFTFENDIADDILSGGAATTFGPFPNPMPGAARIYFRVITAN